MAKIAVCYFSYYKDIDFLNNSLKVLENTIERHPEHEVKVYVFDDGRCDKHLKKKELHGNPTFITTYFDRKGNLNGYECIDGMFNEYRKITEKFDCDYLIKLDSDCVLNSFDYLYAVEEEMKKHDVPMERVAQIGSYFAQLCVHGCCQTFTKTGITTVCNLFTHMNKAERPDEKIMRKRVELGYNEDKVVSVLLEMAPVIRVNIDTIPNIKGNCNAFHCPESTDLTEFTSVAFKPNYFADVPEWTREKSLEVMNKHVENMV